MKILSWNIKGLNSSRKIKILNKNIKKKKMAIVFLQETKCLATQIQDLSKKIWTRSEWVGLDARGYSRGLGILWDSNRVSLEG